MKYSDLLAEWLVELGYTHCFFLAGGNIMHLLESCSRRFTCVAVVHEVAAGIAAEYFNEVSASQRAFALVTAGPGLTNIVTALAGAYLEGRELLVLGGQVKVADCARGEVRQRGIQEVDGVAIARPVTVAARLLERTATRAEFREWSQSGSWGRKGPVFLEVPLDVQGARVDRHPLEVDQPSGTCGVMELVPPATLGLIGSMLRHAERPVLLLGGDIRRDTAASVLEQLESLGVPLMTTWNALDRIPSGHPCYFGRPNTWGQRHANLLLQQADLVVALGTRLGLQQTGFNWREFVPSGKVVQVHCDQRELNKGHPNADMAICGDANEVLRHLAEGGPVGCPEWMGFCREVGSLIPLNDPANRTADGYVSPYEFMRILSLLSGPSDVIVPCSSGGANTVAMQAFQQKRGQIAFNNGSLAAMGYGLSGAIGAAFAAGRRRTILIEGDGGFMQNMQELGTVMANRLNLKIFLFDDNGYASIRMMQRNYFKESYLGCDPKTGLGIPNWQRLFAAYHIPSMPLVPGFERDPGFLDAFDASGPAAFLVQIDPEQTYYPKIASRITASGSMESDPLHRMTPDLDEATEARVLRYLPQLVGAGGSAAR